MSDNPVEDSASELCVIASSAQGKSHVHRDEPCEDAHQISTLSESVFVAAVADGAGSVPFAKEGAACAVREVVSVLSEDFLNCIENETEAQLLTKALRKARGALEQEAEKREVEAHDLASTIIALAVTTDAAAVGHIGDGAVVLCREADDGEKVLETLTYPQKGRYVNETLFLTSPDAIEQAQIEVWHGEVYGVAACTDGLEHMMLEDLKSCEPRKSFLLPLFKYVARVQDSQKASEKLSAFLQSPKIADRTVDDVTLLVAASQ